MLKESSGNNNQMEKRWRNKMWNDNKKNELQKPNQCQKVWQNAPDVSILSHESKVQLNVGNVFCVRVFFLFSTNAELKGILCCNMVSIIGQIVWYIGEIQEWKV